MNASKHCRYTLKKIKNCSCGDCAPVQVVEGEWIQPIRKGYRISCCGCDLVHYLDFRLHKGKIQFRAFLDSPEKRNKK